MIKGKSILYVEDHLPSRQVMELLLKNLGAADWHMFADSEDFAQRLLMLTPVPDIILLDIQLKPLDGFGMLKIIRTLPAFNHVPVAALTASVMNEEIEQLREADFDGAIAKPIELTKFPDLLADLIAGKKVWYVGE